MPSAVLAASMLAFYHAFGPRIHDIQGATHRSPWVDQDVSEVSGVVTQLAPHGFYMQDPEPDDDGATSEGIRVDAEATVRVGDPVEVSGTVRETRPGCARCGPSSDAYANLTTTEITQGRVVVAGTAMALPEPVRIGERPGERRPPTQIIAETAGDVESGASAFDPSLDGLDFYESLEGMLVEIDGARVVGPTSRPRGRARELVVVPYGASFGPITSNGGLLRAPGDDNPERITVVHDGLPDMDVGDAFTEPIIGVVDYDFGRFNLIAARAPTGLRPFARTPSPPLAEVSSDTLTLATFNVENLAPSSTSRMDDIARIVAEDLGAPDVVVLQEIQDDSGPADDGATSAARTYALLLGAIVSHGGPRYDWRDVPPDDGQDGGEPGGNIRVGFLLRNDRGMRAVDRAAGDRRGARVVRGADGGPRLDPSPARVNPADAAFVRSRKPVAIELDVRGIPVFVVGVHFDSQLGDQPIFGRFQPPEKPSRRQRIDQARIVGAFVEALRAVDPRARIVVAGDMNDVDGSPPLSDLAAAGLRDLGEKLEARDRYTHLFEGNAESLDHVLATDALTVGGLDVRIVHVDADFAQRPSDHDPVIVRFGLQLDHPSQPPSGGSCACLLSRRPGACGSWVGWTCGLGLLTCVRRRSARLLSQRCFSGKDPGHDPPRAPRVSRSCGHVVPRRRASKRGGVAGR